MKKRCSGVNPSRSAEVLRLEVFHERHPGEPQAAVVGDVLAQRELAVQLHVATAV